MNVLSAGGGGSMFVYNTQYCCRCLTQRAVCDAVLDWAVYADHHISLRIKFHHSHSALTALWQNLDLQLTSYLGYEGGDGAVT